MIPNDNKIGMIFVNLVKSEGNFHDGLDQEGFVKSIFAGTGLHIPALDEVLTLKNIIPWKELKTGDIAVYSNGNMNIIGVVAGMIERQVCYVDPLTSTVKLEDYSDCMHGCPYINGVKVMSIGE